MRYIIMILLFLPLFSSAQTVIPTGAVNQLTYQRGGYGADSVLGIPVRDTFCNNFIAFRCKGRITIHPANGILYYHNGTSWQTFNPTLYNAGYGLGLSGNTFFADTSELATQFDLTQVAADSNIYVTVTRLNDSLLAIRSVLNGKLNISDTPNMLLPYLRKADSNTRYVTPYYGSSNYILNRTSTKQTAGFNIDTGLAQNFGVKATVANGANIRFFSDPLNPTLQKGIIGFHSTNVMRVEGDAVAISTAPGGLLTLSGEIYTPGLAVDGSSGEIDTSAYGIIVKILSNSRQRYFTPKKLESYLRNYIRPKQYVSGSFGGVLVQDPATGLSRYITNSVVVNKPSVLQVGNYVFSLPANMTLTRIVITASGAETIRGGTTNGGTDLFNDTPFGAGVPTAVSINKYFSQSLTQNIYLNGAVGSVNYLFYYE